MDFIIDNVKKENQFFGSQKNIGTVENIFPNFHHVLETSSSLTQIVSVYSEVYIHPTIKSMVSQLFFNSLPGQE